MIRLVDAATGSSRAIAPPDNRPAVSAAWSGSGKELLYSLASRGGGVRVIRHDVAADRGQAILSLPANSGMVDVLSPGRLIFDTVSARENLRDLAIGRVAESETRWLTRGNSAERQPAYSPMEGRSSSPRVEAEISICGRSLSRPVRCAA